MTNTNRPTKPSHTDGHQYCEHEASKAGRAACRKIRKAELDAYLARRDALLAQLDTTLGGMPLLDRVCLRYSGGRHHDHADHACKADCADAILVYIDYQAADNYIVPETNMRSHAFRMFS
jgi:hypothetical protein